MIVIARALSATSGMEVSVERQWTHMQCAALGVHPTSGTFHLNGIRDDSVRLFLQHLGDCNMIVAPSGPDVLHLSELYTPSNSGHRQLAPDPWPAQLVTDRELYDTAIHLGDERRKVTPRVEDTDSRQKALAPRRMRPQAFHCFPSLPPSNSVLQAQASEMYSAHVFPPLAPLPPWEICATSHILDGSSSHGTICKASITDGARGVEQFFESESTTTSPSAFAGAIEDGLKNAFEMPDCFTSFDAFDFEILGSWPEVGKGPGHTDLPGTGIGCPIATTCESGSVSSATASAPDPAASNSVPSSIGPHTQTNQPENVSARCLPKPPVPPELEGRPPASPPDQPNRLSKSSRDREFKPTLQLEVLTPSDSSGTTSFPFTSDGRRVPGISSQPPPSQQSDSKPKSLRLMPQLRPDPKSHKPVGPQKSGGLVQLLEIGAAPDTRCAHMHVDKSKEAEDHVARERRRRDLMNTRFQTLDTLIPQPDICRKRERLGIVEEAMSHVKQMQQKVLDLGRKKQRLHTQELELKLRRTTTTVTAPETSPAEKAPTSSRSTNMIQGRDMSEDLKVNILVDDADDNQDLMVFIRCNCTCTGTLLGRLLRLDSFQLSSKDIPSTSMPALAMLAPTIIDHMVAALRPFVEPTCKSHG